MLGQRFLLLDARASMKPDISQIASSNLISIKILTFPFTNNYYRFKNIYTKGKDILGKIEYTVFNRTCRFATRKENEVNNLYLRLTLCQIIFHDRCTSSVYWEARLRMAKIPTGIISSSYDKMHISLSNAMELNKVANKVRVSVMAIQFSSSSKPTLLN